MANKPNKSKDPTEVALSAIQDALDMRETRNGNGNGNGAGTGAVRETRPSDDDLFVEAPPVPPAREDHDDERPARAASSLASTLAANDDRASIGQILQTLQRRPSRTPYVIAGVFSAAWIVCAWSAVSFRLDYRGLERAPSTSSQTAWALLGLMAAGEVAHPAVARGVKYLMATQTEKGLWDEARYTATEP